MATMQAFEYTYCPLVNPTVDLRILRLVNIGQDGIINAEISQLRRNRPSQGSASAGISHVSEQKAFPLDYNALSWCWRASTGADTSLEVMHLICNGSNYKFMVSPNLAAALRVLIAMGVTMIWIDWICINQSDLKERSNQVQMMSTIYGEAECVYVWLGEERDDSKEAFQFIPELLKTSNFSTLIAKEQHQRWGALKNLMMRDWFSRRWIIQEIALAKKAKLLCGSSSLDWSHFADAISLFNVFETSSRGVSDLMMSQEQYKHHPDFLGAISALGAARLVDITDNLFRPGREDRHKRDRIERLEKLVCGFTAFNASEARDTVYAILAIARDTLPQTDQQVEVVLRPQPAPDVDTEKKMITASKTFATIFKEFAVSCLERMQAARSYKVDYALPISDIYVGFVRFCIRHARETHSTQALDILCRPWAPDPDSFDLDHVDEEPEHGHWRARFGHKKDYEGGRAKNPSKATTEFLYQSPRPRQPWRPINIEADTDTIPSWIPSISRFSYGWDGVDDDVKLRMTRKNADILVGEPGKSIYSACGSKGVTRALRFEHGVIEDLDDPDIDNTHYHSAYVEGFVLGTVATTSERSQSGTIPKPWSSLVERNPPSSGSSSALWSRDAAENFWRTLFGDRTHTGQNTPRCYRLVLEQNYNGAGDVDLSDQLYWGTCAPAKEVARRIHAMIWNRKLMRVRLTGDQNRRDEILGLAPDGVKDNDLICILYGCSVPVVMRRIKKSGNVLASQRKQQKQWAEKRLREFFVARLYSLKLEQAAVVCRATAKLEERGIVAQTAAAAVWEALRQLRLYRNKKRKQGVRLVTLIGEKAIQYVVDQMLPETQVLDRELSGGSGEPIGESDTTAGAVRQFPPTNEFALSDGENVWAETSSATALQEPLPPPLVSRARPAQSPDPVSAAIRRLKMPPVDLNNNLSDGPLRRAQPRTREPDPALDKQIFYKLIGECYVHRMMDGEGIERRSHLKLPNVLFEIR